MRSFSCSVLLLLSLAGFAQTKTNSKITGKVVDAATQKPIEYATITLSDAKLKPITGAVSDARGVFEVTNVPLGIYTITIDFIGYKIYKMDTVQVTEGKKNISLNTIQLTAAKETLASVTVTCGTFFNTSNATPPCEVTSLAAL